MLSEENKEKLLRVLAFFAFLVQHKKANCKDPSCVLANEVHV
jgi:hypothetical protein